MSRKPRHCRSCGAPIWWAAMESSGRPAPIDAEPVPHGNILLSVRRGSGELVARVIKSDERVEPGRNRYVSHFSTCTNASKHRKASS